MALKPEDLTQDQVIEIWNGCGSDTIPIKPPHFLFGHASIMHDILYYIGGDESDRLIADQRFLAECLQAVKLHKCYKIEKVWYTMWAYVYYYGLRAIGNKGSFESGPKAETFDDIRKKIIKDREDAFGSLTIDAK